MTSGTFQLPPEPPKSVLPSDLELITLVCANGVEKLEQNNGYQIIGTPYAVSYGWMERHYWAHGGLLR
jgi:hypothetical protein